LIAIGSDYMPYWKCSKCHHEWEGSFLPGGHNGRNCDWCQAPDPTQLEETTPLEAMLEELYGSNEVVADPADV
jgi:hypothetical protein